MKILHIEITTHCNLRCRHCRINAADYVAEHMPMSVFYRLLPAMEAFRPHVILNGHGEPLVHPHWTDVFRETMLRAAGVEFQTNAQLLAPALIDTMLSFSGRWDRLKISIEGTDAESYEANRVGAKWDRLRENMAYLSAQPDRPPLTVEFVAMRGNVHRIPAAARLLVEWGGDVLQISDLNPWLIKPEMRHLDGERIVDRSVLIPELTAARRICEAHGAHLEVSTETAEAIGWHVPRPAEAPDVYCMVPLEVAFVTPQGDVQPCCRLREPVGNVLSADLESVWRGAAFSAFRESMHTGRVCAGCRSCNTRRLY